MSLEVWSGDELLVVQLCGPAVRGGRAVTDRRLWQFTTPRCSAQATLSRVQVESLIVKLEESLR